MQDMENQPEGSQSPFNPFMPPNGGEPNLFGNPFGPSSMFPNQMPKSNPFMPNNLSDSDIDRMIADIDKKLKELDEEEAKEKQKKQENPFLAELPKPLETSNEMQEKHGFAFMNPVSIDENHLKPQEPVLPKLEPKQEDKPKINVDADSIIMNDNLITDDEFFDDFFGDE